MPGLGKQLGLTEVGLLEISLYLYRITWSLQHSEFSIEEFLTCRLRASKAHIPKEKEPGSSGTAFHRLGTLPNSLY